MLKIEYAIRILSVLLVLFCFACEDLVEVELPRNSGGVFIDAVLEAGNAPRVIVGSTAGYNLQEQAPRISDAKIEIVDLVGGEVYRLSETSEKGEYSSATLKGLVGAVYELRVSFEGKTYTAMDSLLPVAPIVNMKVDFAKESDPNRSIIIDFEDPLALGNNYRWVAVIDNYALYPTRYINIAEDQLFNGALVRNFVVYNGSYMERCRPGAKVQLLQMSLSQAAFRFYKQLQEEGRSATPFSTPPANLPTNFDNGAYGFFRATDVYSSRELIVAEH